MSDLTLVQVVAILDRALSALAGQRDVLRWPEPVANKAAQPPADSR